MDRESVLRSFISIDLNKVKVGNITPSDSEEEKTDFGFGSIFKLKN